jgi:formylglycine-generating enzyme required for sulfatase activity
MKTIFSMSLLLFFCFSCSDKNCPTCQDTANQQTGDCVQRGDQQDVQANETEDTSQSQQCNKGKITCGTDEEERYGICVKNPAIQIPASEFSMGFEGGGDFSPVHTVSLDNYLIDRTEVTNAAYQACVVCGYCKQPLKTGSFSGRETYYGNEKFSNFPAVNVTWEMASEYCTGLGLRLPTEAEWEFAARGKDGRTYPWGQDAPSITKANYNYNFGDTSETGIYGSGNTPEGISDLAGNVWEWVYDFYDPAYYQSSPSMKPEGPETGISKVVRGGSFASAPADLKSYARYEYFMYSAYSNVGFRCAK